MTFNVANLEKAYLFLLVFALFVLAIVYSDYRERTKGKAARKRKK